MINRFRIVTALFLWLSGPGLWALDVRTTINAIAHEGNFQALGIFTIVIDSNAFPNAAPGAPVYIRFRTLQSNGWSHSLVDLRLDAEDEVNQPINLAILPPASGLGLNPGLPADAIQIVRLIKGEKEGWLRIKSSSSTWIQGATPPTPENSVSVTVGIGGFDSIQAGTNTHSGGNEFAISRFPAGTVLRANYRNTPTFGNGDLEFLDFVGYDSTTTGVEDGDTPFPGAILGVGFSNDLAVARGTFNFPCLDYHFAPENFEAPAYRLPISRINLIDFRKYQFNIPPLYLTNTSDFQWQQGTNLFLTLPDFDTDLILAGLNHPGSPDPNLFPIQLAEGEVKAVSQGEATWQITALYWGDELAGYRFVLEQGSFGINDRLTITGMRGSSDEDFAGRGLILAASAYYRHEQITFGELKSLGPLSRKTIELFEADPTLSRKVVPYTAYDQPTWAFNLHLLNPSEDQLAYTALFYNRHGILLRILGNQSLQPNSKRVINIGELFGPEAQGILSWVEVLSEQPFQALGEIRDDEDKILDIFPANDTLQKNLYGIHLPSDIARWRTKAYVVSADLSSDTEFNMMLPGAAPVRVNSIFLPGGTAILGDGQFINEQGRQPWFQVETTSDGAGILYYSRNDDSPQLVSILMNTTPVNQWRFDHLGNPDNEWWNGLVLFNPQEEAIRVTVRGLRANGVPMGDTLINIPAMSKQVALVSQFLPSNEPPAMLSLSSTQDFLSFLLIGREDRSILTRVSGNVPSASRHHFAYIPKNDHEWLGLALFNPQAAAQEIVVTLVDPNGQNSQTYAFEVQASTKSIIDLRAQIGDLTGFSHLQIEGDAPFRAFGLTGNDAGTQLATLDSLPLATP